MEEPLAAKMLGPAPAELRGCSRPDCPEQAIGRGLCRVHYQRAWRLNQLPVKTVPRVALVSRRAWMTSDLDRALRRLSRITGKTCSEIIREALTKYLTPPS